MNRTTPHPVILRPISGSQVVVRTEATSLCYFNVSTVLGMRPDVPANAPPMMRTMRDGSPVYANSEIGGLAELMVTYEEWVIPVVTGASAADLGTVCSCVSVAGLGATTSQGVATLPPGATAAVVGCGPLGLSAVQGARIAGAGTIIAIDPIAARREVTRKLGATFVLDPNAEGATLVAKVQQLTMRDNPSVLGGRPRHRDIRWRWCRMGAAEGGELR